MRAPAPVRRALRAFDAVERFVARPRVRALLVVLAIAVLGIQQLQIKTEQSKRGHDEAQLAILVHSNESAIDRERAARKAQVAAQVEARLFNCENGNKLRAGLRENVKQGQRNLPLFLKLLPQLNTTQILAINAREVSRQLRAFHALDCVTYSREVLPGAKAKPKAQVFPSAPLLPRL